MPRWRTTPLVVLMLAVLVVGIWYLGQGDMSVVVSYRGGIAITAGQVFVVSLPLGIFFAAIILMAVIKPARYVTDWTGLRYMALGHTIDIAWHEIERLSEKKTWRGDYRIILTPESIAQRGRAFEMGIDIPAAAGDLRREIQAWLSDRRSRPQG